MSINKTLRFVQAGLTVRYVAFTMEINLAQSDVGRSKLYNSKGTGYD